MAVTFLTGFEAQQAATDNITLVGTAAYSTAQARTGIASVRCNPASGASGYIAPGPTGSEYVHFGLYVASLPSVERQVAGQTGAGQINVRLTSAGALAVYLNTTLIGTSSATFAAPGWHWVGVRMVTGTSVAFLQIDGSNAVTGTATVTAQDNRIGFLLTEASAVDVYIDDAIIDDTGFLAPSKVALLVPISDNANTGDVLWRLGDATAMGGAGWAAIDNIPPAGVASANETATTNIEHPGNSSTGNCIYTANLTTYTDAGVLSGDTVLAVQPLTRHGEDITTGTKTITTNAMTNPTVIGAQHNAGDDVGAHGAESGNWQTRVIAAQLVTSPSVTLGTSPTIAVNRGGTETRVVCIDFMGAYVAWTPQAAAPHGARYRQMTVLQAVKRASSY